MILVVARKEWLTLRRDGRLRWALWLTLGLLAFAAGFGWLARRTVISEIEAARAADRAAWLDQGPRNPHSAAHFGQYAFKPAAPLSFFDPGVDPGSGRALWLEAHYQNPPRFRELEDRTAVGRLANLTPARILSLLVPLVVVLLAFGAIAGEREAGTWRLLLAQGVSRTEIALGKFLGIAAFIALPLALVGAAALTALALTGAGPDAVLRCALLCLSYAAYWLAVVGVAIAVSAASATPRTALVALFAIWLFDGVVAGRLLADLSSRVIPTPGATDFWAQVAEDQSKGIDGHNPSNARAAELEKEVLARYGVQRVDELPVNFDALALQAGEEYGDRVFDRRWGQLWGAYRRQEAFVQRGAVVAPSIALTGLSRALAGTDLFAHEHFAAAAEEHRRAINRQLNDHMARNAGREGFDWRADPRFWQEVPVFDYSASPVREAVRSRFGEALTLAGWALLGPLLAVLAVRRATVV